MATIYNSNLTKELVDVAKIQTSRDSTPTQLADKVVPVIDVNPKHSRIGNFNVQRIGDNSTGSKTIHTAASDRETYITGISITMIKDAACDAATASSCQITISVGGLTCSLISLSLITLTAQSFNINREFSIPIKIDKGSTVNWSATYGAGVMVRSCCLNGYTLENTNA